MAESGNSKRNWVSNYRRELSIFILFVAVGACATGFSRIDLSSTPEGLAGKPDQGAYLNSGDKALDHFDEGTHGESTPGHQQQTATDRASGPDTRPPPQQPEGRPSGTGHKAPGTAHPYPTGATSGAGGAGSKPRGPSAAGGAASRTGARSRTDTDDTSVTRDTTRPTPLSSMVLTSVSAEVARTLLWLEAHPGQPIAPSRMEVEPLPGLDLRSGRLGKNTLLVVPRDEVGRGRPMCTDGLFVQVITDDGVRIGGEVTCEDTCQGATCPDGSRYRVTYWLPCAGAYNVTVRTTGTLLSGVCFDYGDERGLVATMRVIVPQSVEVARASSGRHDAAKAAVHNVAQHDVTGSSSESGHGDVTGRQGVSGRDVTRPKEGRQPRLRRRGDVTVAVPTARDVTDACSPELFYRGRFETVQSRFAFRRRSADVTWRPSGDAEHCDWPAYWPEEKARGCLAGKWIFIFGDSTLEEIAVEFLRGVYGSFNESWNHPRANCAGHKFESQRIWDTGFISPTLPRLTFYWIGNGDPCHNGGGLESFDHPGVEADLRAFFGQDWTDPTKARRVVDLLIINSGLHDLSNRMPFNFTQYLTRLDKTLSSLSRVAHTPIWKTTSPKFRRYTCRGSQGTQPHVELMNRGATPLARAHGFQIADQYAMSVAYPEQSDGHHCRSKSSCQNFGASLLNFACQPRAKYSRR